jgi:allantoinase
MKPSRTGPFNYLPIIKRPKLTWPNGKRLAFWVIPNIETFALNEKMPDGNPVIPNVFAWSRREYGNRVGVFRIMKILERYGIRATVALNSNVCADAPAVIEEGIRLGWEWMGHGETNTRKMSDCKSPEEEREVVLRTLDTIAQATGKRPIGWLGPGLQETWDTLDILSEQGIKYVGDWTCDDQPYSLNTAHGPLLSIPYGHDMGDKTAVDHLSYPPEFFMRMMIDTFNVLYRESADSGRIMPLSLHPYITGVPHRIDYLDRALEYISRHDDVWFATGSEIMEHYLGVYANKHLEL